MADLLQGDDLPSSDEDSDYNPLADPDLGEGPDERAARLAAKKGKRLPGGADGEDEAADEDALAEERAATATGRTAAARARVDEAFAALLGGGAAAPAPAAAPLTAAGPPSVAAAMATAPSLASLCVPVKALAAKANKRPAQGDASWRAALGLLAPPAKKAAGGGGGAAGLPPQPPPAPPAVDAAALAIAAAALAAAPAAAATGAAAGRVAVVETKRFAGKEVSITRTVQAGGAGPAAAKAAAAAAAAAQKEAARSAAGLEGVVASLAAPAKATTVAKSRSDWGGARAADAGLDAELDAAARSGKGYLDRTAFLAKSDLAAYEKERDARLASDVRTRGRL